MTRRGWIRSWGALAAAALLWALAGCSSGSQGSAPTAEPQIPQSIAASQTRISAGMPGSAEVDTLIAPYRRQLEGQMNEVLAYLLTNMQTGRPEGLLGNLIADITLSRAVQEADVPVDACVINNGGLRVPWSRGEITLGLVYEVMPFDNEIVILRFSGEQVAQLANEIAARRGEPISGLIFTIRDEGAADVRVGGRPVGSRDYWIATSDYLANGGGGMPTLWEPAETRLTGVFIRDAIADALRAFGAVGAIPVPDMGRIKAAP